MSLETIAQNLASKGRNGDTMLVHMTPGEVRGLQQLARLHGTSLTINPYTGMPEAFKLKSVFKSIGNAVKSVVKPIAKVLAPLAPILPFIPIPGIGPLSSLAVRSLLSGTLGGFAGGKGGFDLKRALLTGGAAYGLGSLMQPSSTLTSPSAAAPMSAADYGSAVDSIDASLGALQPNPVAPVPASYGAGFDVTAPVQPSVAGATAPSTTVSSFERIPTVDVTGGTEIIDGVAPVSAPKEVLVGAGANAPTPSTAQGIGNLLGAAGESVVGAVKNASLKDVAQLGTLGFTGYGAITTKAELDRQKEEAERILANQQRETAERVAYAQGILRDYPLMYERLSAEDVRTRNLASGGIASFDDELGRDGYAYGGLAALARGGMSPRYLRGGGDGMSDSIKANIDGKQEARLADGEFVIPADVVSHLGNGSSNAGAKRLYAMMDRVRTARTGKKRQAPAVKTERYMPA